METIAVCWQARPGGRIETTGPLSRDLAEFRLREHKACFPHIRAWLGQTGQQSQVCTIED